MELSKYLIIERRGEPQAVAFPRNVNELDVWEYIHREDPRAHLVSAGFFLDDKSEWWHGGESEALHIKSRQQDGQIIQMMLRSRDRRDWDLRVLVWEACESARRRANQTIPGMEPY